MGSENNNLWFIQYFGILLKNNAFHDHFQRSIRKFRQVCIESFRSENVTLSYISAIEKYEQNQFFGITFVPPNQHTPKTLL